MSGLKSESNRAPYSCKLHGLNRWMKCFSTCWRTLGVCTKRKSSKSTASSPAQSELKLLQRYQHQNEPQEKEEPRHSVGCNLRRQEEYNHVDLARPSRKDSVDIVKRFERTRKKLQQLNKRLDSPRDSGINIFQDDILSSTLISTPANSSIRSVGRKFWRRIASVKAKKQKEEKRDNMLLVNQSLARIQDDFPELEAEVRGILMARVQDGATISQIREDYRNNVGTEFPIHTNIIEFLMSIPLVHAKTDEFGHLTFSVLPTEKTKHMYDLITHQKPAAPQSYSRYPKNNWRSRPVNQRPRQTSGQSAYQVHGQRQRLSQHPEVVEVFVDDVDRESSFWPSPTADDAYKNNCNYYYNRIYNPPTTEVPAITVLPSDDERPIVCQPEPATLTNDRHQHISNTRIDTNNNKDLGPKKPYMTNVEPASVNFEASTEYRRKITQTSGETVPPALESRHYQQSNNFNNINYNKRTKRKRPGFLGPCQRPTKIVRSSSPRSSQYTESCYFSECESDYEAHLLEFPFLGDDFLLYLARMELGCKFKRNVMPFQSGLCVSGQTICAAIERVQRLRDAQKRIIVNIGSVDILQGRSLLQIEHDFRQLIDVMHRKGLQPILTTLAPLANFSHVMDIKGKLQRFNEFIKRQYKFLTIIDIWAMMTNDHAKTRFDCYQSEPRQVTGANDPYVFWNKIGRQRVLKLIESSIEY